MHAFLRVYCQRINCKISAEQKNATKPEGTQLAFKNLRINRRKKRQTSKNLQSYKFPFNAPQVFTSKSYLPFRRKSFPVCILEIGRAISRDQLCIDFHPARTRRHPFQSDHHQDYPVSLQATEASQKNSANASEKEVLFTL